MSDVNRPLRLRKRGDLVADRLSFGNEASWVVKDPLALRFFRFRDEEYAVLEWLDGRRTISQIRDEFEKRFAPQRIRPEDISRFVAQVHEQGLVIADAPEQGDALLQRRSKRRRRELVQRWTNPLTLRFRGIDPQSMLDRLHPWVKPVFTKWGLIVAAVLMIAALTLVGVRWNSFVAKLPSREQFFTPSTLGLLMVTLCGVKIIHEFGHGLTCRHFGGDCHELGFMLLVFTPALYCNVTDAWRFKSKWHRIAVSAAGIYVELVLASLATFGWWFSSPGLFHHLCLTVMIVCSVNTVLFNGNPLLRYDGYYVLADLVDTPNFGEKCGAVFRQWLNRLIAEPPEFEDPLLPRNHRFWYGTYHVVSTAYRWVLTLSIMLFLMGLARPYHLENLVRTLGIITIVSMLVQPMKKFYQWMKTPGNLDRVKMPRLATTSLVVAGLLAVLFFVPLPKRVWCTLEVEPREAQRVYVEVPGLLIRQVARANAEVRQGDVLAELANDDLELQIAETNAQLAVVNAKIEAAQLERHAKSTDSPASNAVETIYGLRKESASLQAKLAEQQRDRERLVLRADRDGKVLPSPEAAERTASPGELRNYGGRPHEPVNVGCTLPQGLIYCEVGDPHKWEALVVVDQADVPFVRLQMPVEIMVDQLPDVVFHGRVEEISQHELTVAPRHLSNKSGGDLATETDRSGVEKPVTKLYQARVTIDDPHGMLRLGLRGTAKIRVDWEPLGHRIVRWCNRTFHFSL